MLKLENSRTIKHHGARGCDNCRSAASTVYCSQDSAFLCTTCDARIHAASSRHERVWVCEACERAPAAFLCKADAASLCAACDADIHSANPLARRHHRVPITPIPGMLYGSGLVMAQREDIDGDDEDEAVSWLLLNPVFKNGENPNTTDNGGMFGGEGDEYLDLDDYNSSQNSQFNDQCNNNQQQDYGVIRKSHGSDSVVPIQYQKVKENEVQERYYQLGLDYESSNTGYNYPASISHSVSFSPMDVGVVPDQSTSDASISHQRAPKGTIDLFSGTTTIEMPTQLTPMDRQARVLRYREKKKNRKFEKTIRYASRKAYAETRPRIKGRFAKRTTDVEVEVDQMFTTSLMAENAYGIVPSFL
ncbi:hypothetical protein BUALT_Bualt04G0129400 [Buddleja alternifolia]|uniref:CONSTANS-like 1 protein n=1 Tax=Buddleja alternifolia TaxID=168488 RepID=A0AAV6XPW0_9LAMI|nr:hypothetical protein BUALT_Bualt04G0129400 [Buddleja alternifolia]